MALTTLSNKSQIVLPAEIRKRLKLAPGDRLEIAVEGDRILIRKALSSYLDALENCASDVWRDYEKELQQAHDQWDG
jgi:antitoxin PrlF